MTRDRRAGALVVEHELLGTGHSTETRSRFLDVGPVEESFGPRNEHVPDRFAAPARKGIQRPRLRERHRLLAIEPRAPHDVCDVCVGLRGLDAPPRVLAETIHEAKAEPKRRGSPFLGPPVFHPLRHPTPLHPPTPPPPPHP